MIWAEDIAAVVVALMIGAFILLVVLPPCIKFIGSWWKRWLG